MNSCFLWLILLCCCGKKNVCPCCGNADKKRPCGCPGEMTKPVCECGGANHYPGDCDNQPPRPRCVMPPNERFICKADNEETFLDEKGYE